MDTVSNPDDFDFILSSKKKGKAGNNIIRSLMEPLFNTLRYKYKTETPKTIESLPSMNYYLFGVIGQGFDEVLKEARDNLIKELNRSQIFEIFLEEGLKNNLLEELFKDILRQLKDGNKVINNDSTIVVKTLNSKKVIIHVDSLPKKKEKISIMDLPLSSLHGKRDPAKQFKEEKKAKHITRAFAAQIIKALGANYNIKVPKRLETLDAINYYLFGVAYEKDLKKLHQALIQEVNKKDIFDLLLKEGSANDIIQDQFDQIKSKWEKEGGEITEDSFIMIEVLNKDDVIIKTNALKNKTILPIEDEKQCQQKEDNNSSFDIKNQLPDHGSNDPSRDFGVPNMSPRDFDFFEGLPDLFQQQDLNDDIREENPRPQPDAHIPHPQQQQEETQKDQISPHGDTEEAKKKERMERLEESKNEIDELSDLHITSQSPDNGFNDPSKESVVQSMRPGDLDDGLEGLYDLFQQQCLNNDIRENPCPQLDTDILYPQQQQEETQKDQISLHGDTEEAKKKERMERLEESKNLIDELSKMPSGIYIDFEGLSDLVQQQSLNDDSKAENSRSQPQQQQQQETQNDQISPHGDTEEGEKKKLMERLEESKNLIDDSKDENSRSQPQQKQQQETQNEQISPHGDTEEGEKKKLMERLEESKNMINDSKEQPEIAKREAKKYSQLEAKFKKQTEDMERQKKAKEQTIRKLNEEKKRLADETQRLFEELRKTSLLNKALNTENQNLRVDKREISTQIIKLINFVEELKQKLTVKDNEIRRLEGVFQAKTSQRVPTYRSAGTCWGCGGGPGHTWSFSCRRGY